MKLEYFFPVFKEDDIKEYLSVFKKSEFYKKHKENKFMFVCEKDDKKNLEFLSKEALKNEDYKILILDKPFTYNDAFYQALPHFKADVVLFGDTKIARIDLVFEKCLEKYGKEVKIVHIVKRNQGFKGFFKNMFQKIYNFFIRIFTSKKDRCNVISLGLIDKDIIDLLKVLPGKCCFLKNTKNLRGFDSRTIYIDPKTKTYKPNFKQKTSALKGTFIFGGIIGFLITLQIILNCVIKANLSAYNIISILAILLFTCTISILIPKHIFDVRNRESLKQNFNVEQINKD